MKRNNKVSLIRKIIVFFNVLAVLALLLCYISTVANPSKYGYIAFFGLAYPFILLGNIIFIVYWIFRRSFFVFISLVSILLGWNMLSATIGFRSKTYITPKEIAGIKLLTYNVHYLKKNGVELDSATRQGIFNIVREEQPDVVGFLEFFSRSKGVYNTKDSILNILGTKYFHYQKQLDNDFESAGIALFSKFPIIRTGEVNLEDAHGGNGAIWADIQKEHKIIRIFLVHLSSISFQPQDYQYLSKLKADLNPDEDVNSGKRIIWKLKNAFERRGMQVNSLKATLDTCKMPYLVMGDFNDTPVSYTINTISKGLKNAFKEKGSGLAITYNGAFPNFQIDYILGTPNFNFETYKIIKKTYSDHYPVVSNVSLQE